jgi:hypothetical protein
VDFNLTLSPPNEKEFSRIQFHIKTSVNVTKYNNNKNNPLCVSDWKVQENVERSTDGLQPQEQQITTF